MDQDCVRFEGDEPEPESSVNVDEPQPEEHYNERSDEDQDTDEQDDTTCHMYKNSLPKEGDLVVVKIISVDDLGARCQLLEYGGIEGMMPSTEYSRKHIKSIKKLIRPGNKDVLCVINVDNLRSYIDLSKKNVTQNEIVAANDKFYKSNFVHNILRHIAVSIPCQNGEFISLKDLYNQLVWPMYDDYEHAFNGLQLAAKNYMILDKYGLPQPVYDLLHKMVEVRFAEQPKTVSCVLEVSCIGRDGIKAVKASLLKALSVDKEKYVSNETNEIKIQLIKSPEYSISGCAIDTAAMSERIHQMCNTVQQEISLYEGGIFAVKEQIKIG